MIHHAKPLAFALVAIAIGIPLAAADRDDEIAGAKDPDLAKLNPRILQALLDFEKEKRARIDKLVEKKASKRSIEKAAAETWHGEPASIPLKPGMVGSFLSPGTGVLCDQAVDERNFIGTIRDFPVYPVGTLIPAGRPSYVQQEAWFKGYDTADLQDGQRAELDGFFIVGGTKRYETVLGGTRQLVVLEPFDLTPYYAQLKKQGAIAEVPDLKKKAERTPETPAEKAQREEKLAAGKLKSAEALLKAGKRDSGHKLLQELVEKYPETKAAGEAKKLLK